MTASKMKWAAALPLLAIGLGVLPSACAVGPDQGLDDVETADQALCENRGGVNAVQTALAVAAARDLRRWNAPQDFEWNSSSGMLQLRPGAASRCHDGVCKNVVAVLAMQRWEAHQKVTFPGNVRLDVNMLRSALKAGYDRQVRCNNYWGEFSSNGCWVEAHDLWYDHVEDGSCDVKYFFWRNKAGTGQGLDHPDRLKYQLYFAGFPENKMLNFYQRDWQVSIDPTSGLNEGSSTTSGSCTMACTQFAVNDKSGQCCSCNGATRRFARSAFSPYMYLCQ